MHLLSCLTQAPPHTALRILAPGGLWQSMAPQRARILLLSGPRSKLTSKRPQGPGRDDHWVGLESAVHLLPTAQRKKQAKTLWLEGLLLSWCGHSPAPESCHAGLNPLPTSGLMVRGTEASVHMLWHLSGFGCWASTKAPGTG